jgi:putative spermidine/putrescine transport system substrate-binding protein
MITNPISRRRMLKHVAGASMLLGAPAIVRAQDEENVVVYGSRGGILEDIFRKVILEPLTAQTGLQVKMVPYPEMAKIKAMVETNSVDFDIWEPDGKEVSILGRRGLLEPIDYSLLQPDLREDLIDGSIQKYGVGEVVFGAGIVYNRDRIPKDQHPKTWTEFWDTAKFPGPRTMPDASYLISPLEPALLADGVGADKLYPLDLDRAFASLDRIKSTIVKFWNKAGEGMNLMTSKNADLAMQTFGRTIAVKREDPNSPLEIEFNQAMAKLAYWAIPKGAKHQRNAHKLIRFFCEPKNHAAFINAYPAYGPASKKSAEFIDPKNQELIISSPLNVSKLVMVNDVWWAEQDPSGQTNFERILERWNGWVAG